VPAEENRALIPRFVEAIDAGCKAGDAEILDEFLAPGFVEHNPFPGIPPTRECWKQAFGEFAAGAPGYRVVEDLVAEGDTVAGGSRRTAGTKGISSVSRRPVERSASAGSRSGASSTARSSSTGTRRISSG
jgi:hypothetical protein